MHQLLQKLHNRLIAQYQESGFSLLELVVAVSIMLVLGTIGTVSYQTYTDNARQANVDSEANQVLTAAVAAENVPGDDVHNAVREYNKSSSEITANITEANKDRLTLRTTDQDGTVGVATINGDYRNVEITRFSEPGVTFGWVGEPNRSASIKYKDGKEVARNSFSNQMLQVERNHAEGEMREYQRYDREGKYVVDDKKITIHTSLDGTAGSHVGAERYGVRFNLLQGWNEGDVIRVKVNADLADGHRALIYADQHNTDREIEGTTSAKITDEQSNEDHILEIATVPGAVSMTLLLWIDKAPDVEPGLSTATFSDIYIGPADVEYFDGDSV